MKDKKKRGLLEISVLTVKLVLCVWLIFMAFVFVYYGMIVNGGTADGESIQYIENWTVTDDEGNVFTTGRHYVAERQYKRECTIESRLPMNVKDSEYLFFDTRKDTEVYVNGELRKDFVAKRDVNIPGGLVRRFYLMVPLRKEDSGAELKIVITPTVKDEQIVAATYIGTRYAQFSHLMREGGLSFFLASIVLIFSFVAFVVSLVLRYWYKLKLDMTYGALGIFIIAFWIITDSYLFPYVFGVNYVDGILNYMLCFMIPIAPGIYLNSVQHGRYRKSVSALMMVSAFNGIVWPLLHFTGVVPFYDIRNVVNVILVIMSASAIALLVVDAIKGNIAEYRYTFIGFLGFLVCCIVEILLVMIVMLNDSLPMVAGLAFLLTFVVIQQVDVLRKINMEKQRAIDVSEAKTKFLASMSHEIRTPINAILGMNEMILRENTDGAIEEYARNIKNSGKMLLMLVNDVLDFSKIEAGKLEINEARFLTAEMLRDVFSVVKERADEKSLELKTEITNEVPEELISDEFRIRQVLVNLINNAVKYTDRGSVTLRIGGSYARDVYELSLLVKDTGKGIRKEDQTHLFEAFTRADVKSNVNIEGTGLGLAIVKSIVDSMKGTLGVESEYGVGSEFWVKLPVKYANQKPMQEDFMADSVGKGDAASADVESFTAPEAKILAVDDNQSNLKIVQLFLKRTGIKPDLCSTGTRAMELCVEKKYDLILLDHMMPAPDGIETLHFIKSDAKSLNHDTKTVVLTANAVAGSRKKYLEEGFDDYLTKPLDSKLLEETVKSLLPKEKILEGPKKAGYPKENGLDGRQGDEASGDETLHFEPVMEGDKGSEAKSRFASVAGLDYKAALSHCAEDEELLAEIISDISAEGAERSERMKKSLAEKDLKAYEIEAHTIKSTMATIGMKELSARAREHELAAKNGDLDLISKDAESFIDAYLDACKRLGDL